MTARQSPPPARAGVAHCSRFVRQMIYQSLQESLHGKCDHEHSYQPLRRPGSGCS